MTPANGLPGSSATISGSGFLASGNTVTIAGQSAAILNQSATAITVTIPTGACSGVAVTNSCGAVSNTVLYNGQVTPTVSISVQNGSTIICSTSPVTFIASPVYGGSAPVYKWYVNNVLVQSGSSSRLHYICIIKRPYSEL
ncbi:MAG: hypothetical protein U0T74_12380 [Chitinophagales bacterium]